MITFAKLTHLSLIILTRTFMVILLLKSDYLIPESHLKSDLKLIVVSTVSSEKKQWEDD